MLFSGHFTPSLGPFITPPPWILVFFFRLLTSWIIYMTVNRILEPLLRRASSFEFSRFHKETKSEISLCQPSYPIVPHDSEGTNKKKRCVKCPWQKDKKSTEICVKCASAICNDHIQYICNDCWFWINYFHFLFTT